jgi:hypothetical protein
VKWRLDVLTVVAKATLMAAIVVAGASIVRNVTDALMAAVGVCETGIAHLL